MKSKVKRVQSNQVDFSVLPPDVVDLYIWGCVGSLVSTISNQCLYDPQLVVDTIHSYVVSFDSKVYLSEARADKAAFETRCKELLSGC